MNIGAHLSIAGGIDKAIIRAAESEFNCVQLFTHSPRNWAFSEIPLETVQSFIQNRKKYNIKFVVIHAPYLPNLASPEPKLWERSINVIAEDLLIADKIKADFYVIHPGSHKGEGVNFGISRIVDALSKIFSERIPKLKFLLETTAGSGFSVGGKFEELDEIIKKIKTKFPKLNIGVCLDTAHIFAAGYDFRTSMQTKKLLNLINKTIGNNSISVIHSNDSKMVFGSHKDRHAHIGKGEIGLSGFSNLLEIPCFKKIPWILETPKEIPESDLVNRATLLGLF